MYQPGVHDQCRYLDDPWLDARCMASCAACAETAHCIDASPPLPFIVPLPSPPSKGPIAPPPSPPPPSPFTMPLPPSPFKGPIPPPPSPPPSPLPSSLGNGALEVELAATKVKVASLEEKLQRVEGNNTALTARLADTKKELARTQGEVVTLAEQVANMTALVSRLLDTSASRGSDAAPIEWSCSLAPNHKRCRCSHRFEAGTAIPAGVDIECIGA